MKTLLHLTLAALMIHNSFARDALDEGHGVTKDGWVNIYVGNPELAGLLILQQPIEKHQSISYEGKHPFAISFVMWNGTINETYYKPDGKIISAGWWRLKDAKALDPQSLWHSVDFSYGSDPSFKKHKDPRKKSWKPSPCRAVLHSASMNNGSNVGSPPNHYPQSRQRSVAGDFRR